MRSLSNQPTRTFRELTSDAIHGWQERRVVRLLALSRRSTDVHGCRDYATHKHQNVKQWWAEHDRFHLHFTPTSSSWLNLVERWFGKITNKMIRRGVFLSVKNLIAKIETFIRHNNENPRPYVWTKTAEQILAKVRRGRVALAMVT